MDGNTSDELVTGAILVGGRATRFSGIDKARIDIGGRRIIDRQLAVLRATTTEQMLVTRLGTDWSDVDVPCVTDVVANAGPLGGVLTALTSARTSRVFVLAGDMPFVSVDLVRFLLDRRTTADAVVPRSASGLHPLCAVYKSSLARLLADVVAAGQLAVHRFLTQIATDVVAPEEMTALDPDVCLTNLNAPADLAAHARRAR